MRLRLPPSETPRRGPYQGQPLRAGEGRRHLQTGAQSRGNPEGDFPRALNRRAYIRAIIGLPPNLFYAPGIPACIVVVDKEDAHTRKGILMIDASAGYLKDGPKNRLRAMDIHKI